jgi:hypothetical protein
MSEKIDLAAPDQVKPGTTEYRFAAVVINAEAGFIELHMRGMNGELRVKRWEAAVDQIRALLKANLSTKSLPRRLFERFIADESVDAAISGTPD